MTRLTFAKKACAALASASLVISMSPVTTAFADPSEGGDETLQATGETGSGDDAASDSGETGDNSEGTETGGSETPAPRPEVGGEEHDSTYNLTFESNGGSDVKAKEGKTGDTLANFETPKRSGYRFLGWYLNNKKVESITLEDHDVTLTAKWESNSYIASAGSVKPYLTVKASYSSGGYKTFGGANKAPNTTVTVSNKKDSKRIDRISLKVDLNGQKLSETLNYTMGIKYRVLTSGSWSSWKSDGATAGTSGKRIEAIQIALTGTLAQYYSVYYHVNARTVGEMGWTRDGASAGTSGQARDVQGFQIRIVKKGSKAPGSTAYSYVSSIQASGAYSVKTVKKSVSTASSLGATAGSAKKSGRTVSRIKATASVSGISGGVKYNVYKYKSGWTKWASNGSYTAYSKNRSALAIKMKLTGKMATYCDVYYRVYVKGYGWMGWAKNGQKAGNTSYNLPISAYQMKIVYKGAKAPGSTANYFSGSQGVLCDMAFTKKLQKKANKFSSSTKYLILVDCDACRVGIFKGSKGNWTMIKYWKAGVGAYSSPTVKGTFTTTAHVYEFGNDKGYSCWYATQFYGNYLFHSVVYSIGSKTNITSSGLGTHVSHGCCRLSLSNAKWLYNNIPLGTKVYVYGD